MLGNKLRKNYLTQKNNIEIIKTIVTNNHYFMSTNNTFEQSKFTLFLELMQLKYSSNILINLS